MTAIIASGAASAGWCNRGGELYVEDESGIRSSYSCDAVDSELEKLEQAESELSAYLDGGLEEAAEGVPGNGAVGERARAPAGRDQLVDGEGGLGGLRPGDSRQGPPNMNPPRSENHERGADRGHGWVRHMGDTPTGAPGRRSQLDFNHF